MIPQVDGVYVLICRTLFISLPIISVYPCVHASIHQLCRSVDQDIYTIVSPFMFIYLSKCVPVCLSTCLLMLPHWAGDWKQGILLEWPCPQGLSIYCGLAQRFTIIILLILKMISLADAKRPTHPQRECFGVHKRSNITSTNLVS